MPDTPPHDAAQEAGERAGQAAAIVDAFLEASMRPDPDAAFALMAPGVRIVFPGGRVFRHPRETTASNAARYAWVKKMPERNDVVPGPDGVVVYALGTLHGAWPDGRPFAGNRYVDRFVVRGGKIVSHEVWNDSAERILDPGLDQG